MKRPDSTQQAKRLFLRKFTERRDFRNALRTIWDTPEGKTFFRVFLKHCHVTKTKFESDPYRIVEQESLRRLAISYLHILGRDDPDLLLEEIRADLNQKQQ